MQTNCEDSKEKGTNALIKAPIVEHQGWHDVELTNLILNINSTKFRYRQEENKA